jgi:two-component system phosphate regulon response regulator PhoB
MVLIAEDDEGWRDLLSRWLSAEDYCQVKTVSAGAEVLPAIKKKRPDLIILDHQLGDTTGMEVCRQLKSDPKLKTVPVVILTTMAAEMIKIIEGGGPDHVVVKSGKPDELFAVLEALLPRA